MLQKLNGFRVKGIYFYRGIVDLWVVEIFFGQYYYFGLVLVVIVIKIKIKINK